MVLDQTVTPLGGYDPLATASEIKEAAAASAGTAEYDAAYIAAGRLHFDAEDRDDVFFNAATPQDVRAVDGATVSADAPVA